MPGPSPLTEPADSAAHTPPASHRPSASEDGALRFLKDNLEAIAVAIVMALVIKHFCVEAFKIPTSSMFPTLRGESDNAHGEGDRILVDKFAFLLSLPQRWQVIVFRYPLNRARNFIKRIAGLPNEHLQISEEGDLWVRPVADGLGDGDLRITQKPRDVREQFYRAVYPPPPEDPADTDADRSFRRTPVTLEHYFRADEGAAGGWRLESLDRFVFTGGPAATLRNVPSILEHSDPDTWATSSGAGELVRDARFRMRVHVGEATETATPTRCTLRWQPDSEILAVVTLVGTEGGSEAFIRRGTETVGRAALPVRLAAGRTYDVELEYVDGHLHARVDDKELADIADGRRFVDTREEAGDQRFRIEAEGGPLEIEDLAIDRDLRYENSWDSNPMARRTGIDIPPDSYFMLGDNTANSSDSRRWRLVHVHLKGGRTIRYDYSDSPDYLDRGSGGATLKRVVDADGIERTWAEEDEDDERGSETLSAPFVHEDLIVGRAFLVFWPWTPEFPGRLGFIK